MNNAILTKQYPLYFLFYYTSHYYDHKSQDVLAGTKNRTLIRHFRTGKYVSAFTLQFNLTLKLTFVDMLSYVIINKKLNQYIHVYQRHIIHIFIIYIIICYYKMFGKLIAMRQIYTYINIFIILTYVSLIKSTLRAYFIIILILFMEQVA